MDFDEIRAVAASGRDVVVPASWGQGRTVYGGLSAGLLCDAVSQGIGPDRRLRYLKISFLRPLEADKPFSLQMEEMSSGRTLTVRSGEIVQDDVVRVAAKANFVARMDSDVEVDVFEAPNLKPIDTDGLKRVRGPGLPAFTQFIDFSAATGGLPYQGKGSPELGGWMRFEQAPESITKSHLVCLIDAWPPVAVSYFDRVVPVSTINWVIHFAEPLDGIHGEDYLGYLARINFFKDGYGSSSADIWAPDGRLLAKSYQTFVIYG